MQDKCGAQPACKVDAEGNVPKYVACAFPLAQTDISVPWAGRIDAGVRKGERVLQLLGRARQSGQEMWLPHKLVDTPGAGACITQP